MTRLSVNINKIALLRNARGGNVPDLIAAALNCERFGAEGITVHPRPDERHIRRSDVYALRTVLHTEFNIEGYPDRAFLDMLREVRPAQATLVPDPPQVLTSNAGWNSIEQQAFLKDCVAELHSYGCRVSLFIETDPHLLDAAKSTGADRVEFYTGPYAEQYDSLSPEIAVAPYREAARHAEHIGLGINAGHDLNLRNLRFLKQQLPHLLEVSIGQALIADALYYGLENTIQMYKRCLV